MKKKEVKEYEIKLKKDDYNRQQYEDGYTYHVTTRRAKEGEYVLGFATGISGRGRGYYVRKHTGDNHSKLMAMCEDTYTILWTDNKDIELYSKDSLKQAASKFIEDMAKESSRIPRSLDIIEGLLDGFFDKDTEIMNRFEIIRKAQENIMDISYNIFDRIKEG